MRQYVVFDPSSLRPRSSLPSDANAIILCPKNVSSKRHPRSLPTVTPATNTMNHSTLKIVQFHQYQQQDAFDVELNDEEGLLVHGGGDGATTSEEVDTPGPIIESIDGSIDGADIPVPDDGTDFELDDDTFWQK